MTFTLGVPQIIWVCLVIINIVYTGVKHGKPQGNFNVWDTIIGSAIGIAILYWGGFFS